jgi:phytoene synthase
MELDLAHERCAEIARRSGSSFVPAFRFLSPERRRAVTALYAFCREADDAVDHGGSAAGARLEGWRAELDRAFAGRPETAVGVALVDAITRFRLPREPFDLVLEGVQWDLEGRRYHGFEELAAYCERVASAVGTLCIEIFGCRSPRSRDYARALGIAFQLTNILRDLGEDAARGRIYLPLEDLKLFRVREADLSMRYADKGLPDLLRFECARARSFFRAAEAALPPEDLAALATAEAMRGVYRALLWRVERAGPRVLRERVGLPAPLKLALGAAYAGRALVRGRVNGRA